MKWISASEARSNWFRILDEVASGEVVVIQRRGKRFVLREEKSRKRADARNPDYRRLLRVKRPERADEWRWECWLRRPKIVSHRATEKTAYTFCDKEFVQFV